MKIVIEPSGLLSLNVGDQAMLEVAYRRLLALWPRAEIQIFTLNPQAIENTLPEARPLSAKPRDLYLEHRVLGRLGHALPPLIGKFVDKTEDVLAARWPGCANAVLALKAKLRGDQELFAMSDAIRSADLYLFSGAGMITDAFVGPASRALRTLQHAKAAGAKAAIVGHMFGPVHDESLLRICREVLPQVDLISVRERLTSLPFLKQCGVPAERIALTGDETLELVQELGPLSTQDRSLLGVNIRKASYSGLEDEDLLLLREEVRKLCSDLNVTPEPLAISYEDRQNDQLAVRELLQQSVALEAQTGARLPENTEGVIRRVAKCRLVITGSYHAGVFALAQGIPVVGLAFSDYYAAKFAGLADLFRRGCQWVDGRQPAWQAKFQADARSLWQEAPQLETTLTRAAAWQIAESRAVYDQLYKLMQEKRSDQPAVPRKSMAAAS